MVTPLSLTDAPDVAETARVLQMPHELLLNPLELQALDGLASPHGVIIPDIPV